MNVNVRELVVFPEASWDSDRTFAGEFRITEDVASSPLAAAKKSDLPIGYLTTAKANRETVNYLAAIETVCREIGDLAYVIDDLAVARCRYPATIRSQVVIEMTELYVFGDENGCIDWPTHHALVAAARRGLRVLWLGPGRTCPLGPLTGREMMRRILTSEVAPDETLEEALRRRPSLARALDAPGPARRFYRCPPIVRRPTVGS